MKRVVKFERDETRREARFALIHEAALVGSSLLTREDPRPTIDEARHLGHLLDKLDQVPSVATDDKYITGDVGRKLSEGEHALLLETPEYDLLVKFLGRLILSAKGSKVRDVLDAHDWVKAAPVEDRTVPAG